MTKLIYGSITLVVVVSMAAPVFGQTNRVQVQCSSIAMFPAPFLLH